MLTQKKFKENSRKIGNGLAFIFLTGAWIFLIMFVYFLFTNPIDYKNPEDLAHAAQSATLKVDEVGEMELATVEENPMYGYVGLLSDDVALVGPNLEGYEAGDTISFKVREWKYLFGIYIIRFELL